MKEKKISLAAIQGKFSRNEMKKIMAGSGVNCLDKCQSDLYCNGDNSCLLCREVPGYSDKRCVTSA